MTINQTAFKRKKEKHNHGDTKTKNGITYTFGPTGWKATNPRLAKQEEDKKKGKYKKAVRAVRALKDGTGKAGVPRNNIA